MKYYICLILISSILSCVLIVALAVLLFYYHIKNTFIKGYYLKIIYQISKKYNISDIEKDLIHFIFFTDIYTNHNLEYFNEKFFDILYTGIEKDKLENFYTEINEMINDLSLSPNDIMKDFQEYNQYRSNNWNPNAYNMLIPIFTLLVYNSNQKEKDQKSEKLFHFLLKTGIIIITIKLILFFLPNGWFSLIFDLILSCLYYIIYYFLCKNYESASTLHSFWLLDFFLLILYCANYTELFSSFKIIFFLVFRIFILIFIGMKMLDYFCKKKFQKIDGTSTLLLNKKLDLITKNLFLWEMIFVNIIANICMFASFMYPQIFIHDLSNIMTGLNCSYEKLSIVVCICNSIANYFSLPLLQYSDARIIIINLLQNIVAFITNTFLFVKITQILFGDDQRFINEKEMSLALCPECGEKISTKAIFCPNCGYFIKEVKKNVKKEKENAETEIEDI